MAATPQEAKTFYDARIEKALEACQEAGYKPLFMPELAEARINGIAPWNQWLTTPSIRATGRTKQGNAVVVYGHVPNYLSNPANIKEAKRGLVNYAACIPQEEFQRLVDLEDKKTVWVVDHDVVKRSTSGKTSIEKALEHPQVIPFLGSEERAQRYLQAHARAYNTKSIGVWHRDDLNNESPLARFLFLGYGGNFLVGGNDLDGSGRFLGVRDASAAGAEKISQAPTLDEKDLPLLERIMDFSKTYIPEQRHAEYEREARHRFMQ